MIYDALDGHVKEKVIESKPEEESDITLKTLAICDYKRYPALIADGKIYFGED